MSTTSLVFVFTSNAARANTLHDSIRSVGYMSESIRVDKGVDAGLANIDRGLAAAVVAVVDSSAKQSQLITELLQQPHCPPILAVVESASASAISAAMEAGASDFVVAPLINDELAARIAVQAKRRIPPKDKLNALEWGPYRFNVESRQLSLHGKSLVLTDKEFDLAMAMFQGASEVQTRIDLAARIWGHPGLVHSRTIDTHISRLRRKLDLRPLNGFRLVSVYDVGYRLDIVT